ncbi:MAG: hypothetical protein U5L96_11380 [Owenweeksia sp.]|nr:hypothetical protein [Owenweeksia sp.]
MVAPSYYFGILNVARGKYAIFRTVDMEIRQIKIDTWPFGNNADEYHL